MSFIVRRAGPDGSGSAWPSAGERARGLRCLYRCLGPMTAGLIAIGCGDGFDPSDGALSLSTTTHDFGALSLGGRSPVLVITVSNTGTGSTGTLTVALTGPASDDFALLKDECSGIRLSGGSTCAIEVEAVPSTLGLRQAVVTISGSEGERVTATLSGTGSSSGLSLSPTIATFGEVGVGQTGALKTVIVRNTATTATGPMTVSLTGGGAPAFTITRDICSTTSLERGASCALDVRFAPLTEGSHSATLAVAGASAPSRSVQLLGLGRQPTALTASPAGGHAFGTEFVGNVSAGMSFVITNTGTQPTGALGLRMAGAHPADFQLEAFGCYPTLAAGASCSVEVRFAPTAAGTRTASVIASDPIGSSATIDVVGEALPQLPPPAALRLSIGGPFPPTLIGASTSQVVTVTNPASTATGPLNTSVLACSYDYYGTGCYPSSSFSLGSDTCDGVSLPAGGSCTASITFRPTFVGVDAAQFEVHAPGFGGTLYLSGTGTGLQPSIDNVNFASTVVGTTSASQTIVITNAGPGSSGSLATEISGFVFEVVSNTCAGVSLAEGGFCTIAVRFKPTAPGGRYGSLGITATPGGTIQIQLFGLGL